MGNQSLNELDQAICALARSKAALPDFCRALVKGELFLLMPYHPELIDATLEIKNGSPFSFVRIQTQQGESVLAYTSIERANEGLAKGKMASKKYLIGSMLAQQALEAIGKMNFPMTLNKGCSTGEITLPPNLLCDAADGSVFKPRYGKGAEFHMHLVPPENYPTDVVQAAFEYFRRHPLFRVAWFFTREDQPGAYFVIVLMQRRDEALLHELRLVIQSASTRDHPVSAEAVNENDPEQIASLFQCGKPFYQVPTYQPPSATDATPPISPP